MTRKTFKKKVRGAVVNYAKSQGWTPSEKMIRFREAKVAPGYSYKEQYEIIKKAFEVK